MNPKDGSTKEDGNAAYSTVDVVEIGHYEYDALNKRFENKELTPNDAYKDGAIVGIVGLDEVEHIRPRLFDDSFFHLILYYRLESVKAGVIYLQNIREFQELTHYGRQRHSFSAAGVDLTNLPESELMKLPGWWAIDIYANEGDFYAVDTMKVGDQQQGATGETYGPNSTFTTRTPGAQKV
ncbi:MAG: hypothetical protein AB2693_13580 [Candidatus Thiodiazotropha sp.]